MAPLSWPWLPFVYRQATKIEKPKIWQHQIFTDLLTTTCWGRAVTVPAPFSHCLHPCPLHLYNALSCTLTFPVDVWVWFLQSTQIPPTIISFANTLLLIPFLTISLIFFHVCDFYAISLLKYVCIITNVLICATP